MTTVCNRRGCMCLGLDDAQSRDRSLVIGKGALTARFLFHLEIWTAILCRLKNFELDFCSIWSSESDLFLSRDLSPISFRLKELWAGFVFWRSLSQIFLSIWSSEPDFFPTGDFWTGLLFYLKIWAGISFRLKNFELDFCCLEIFQLQGYIQCYLLYRFLAFYVRTQDAEIFINRFFQLMLFRVKWIHRKPAMYYSPFVTHHPALFTHAN